MIESWNFIQVKIDECISSASNIILYAQPEKCKIYMPKIAIKILKEYYESNVYYTENVISDLRYRGYKVVEGYEFSVVLAHEDYSLYLSNDLINRIEL